MGISDSIRGFVLGLVLTAAGWVMIGSQSGIKLLGDVGWIFFVGGIAVAGLSVVTTFKR